MHNRILESSRTNVIGFSPETSRSASLAGISLPTGLPLYAPQPDLAVIVPYFNPCRYQRRRVNYEAFVAMMRLSGILCITVECGFEDKPFDLPESHDTIQVRGATIWQKERLINLAASWLPKNIKYVCWLDCDILFENPNWAVDTARLLKKHAIVQVFDACIRLNNMNCVQQSSDEVKSFGSIVPDNKKTLCSGRFDEHGHTGYGWAMRREIFDNVGLYEHAIVGTADHYMAHAVYGDYGPCIQRAVKGDKRQLRHLKEWGDKFHSFAKGNLGVVPGRILHLWHGELVNRRYLDRMHDLTRLRYNPYLDVLAEPGQPFRWNPASDKPELQAYFMEYFMSRREDG